MPDIYHTSYLRANIVAWLPIHAEDKVLYIGHAEDVTAKKLMEMSDHVDCAEDLTEHTVGEGSYDYAVCIGTASLAAIPVFIFLIRTNKSTNGGFTTTIFTDKS